MAHPVHALPVELLSRIFALGSQDQHDPDVIPPGTPHFEVLVSHVCQHWRDIALHTPSLWTSIHFRTVVHQERAKQYLARSQRALIDIIVDTCSEPEYIPGRNLFRKEFKPVFAIVTPHIDRWHSLCLKVRDLTCKGYARDVLSSCGSAPRLETLHLWHIENWETSERLFTAIGPPPVVVFEGSLPSLKNIILIGVNVPWEQSKFLEGLTTISFALHSEDVRMRYDLWKRMLSRSPNLAKLSLLYSGPKQNTDDFQGRWDSDPIALPKLSELSLTDLEPGYLCELLMRLEMPAVRKLKMELHEYSQDYSSFVDLLVDRPLSDQQQQQDGFSMVNGGNKFIRGPAFPHLNALEVDALDCPKESWERLLKVSWEVEELEVDFRAMAAGCFQVLFSDDQEDEEKSGKANGVVTNGHSRIPHVQNAPAYSSDSHSSRRKILLPNLQTFRIKGGVSCSDIRDFIVFRRRNGRPLRKWLLNEKMREVDEEMVRFVREMGLEVDMGEREWEKKERVEWIKVDDDDEEEEEEEEGEGSYVEEDEEEVEDVEDEDVEVEDREESGTETDES